MMEWNENRLRLKHLMMSILLEEVFSYSQSVGSRFRLGVGCQQVVEKVESCAVLQTGLGIRLEHRAYVIHTVGLHL